MSAGTYTYGQLWQRFQGSTDVAQVVTDLERLDDLVLSEEIDLAEAYDLRSRAFRTLQELTVDDPEQAAALIQRHLLPFCLRSTREEPDKVRLEISLSRRRLAEWLDQYPEPARNPIRDLVLDEARKHLEGPVPDAACWTVSAVGFRRSDLADALWGLSEEDEGEIGDVALCALVNLGLDCARREAVLASLYQRMPLRRSTVLMNALRRLGDPGSIKPVIQHWLQPQYLEEPDGLTSLSLNILTDVADANDHHTEVQDYVWAELSRLLIQHSDALSAYLHLGGDLAPRCNTEDVVPFLVSWLGRDAGPSDRDAYWRWLLSLRLESCVRPRQLRGWSQAAAPDSVSVLHLDAFRDTGQTGIDTSSEMMHKEKAWATLLCLGDANLLLSYEEAVAGESNPYLQQELNKTLASFRHDPLPKTILGLVTGRFDADSSADGREWVARLSAVDLCQSAGTWEAFEALLSFGLTVDGQVLLSSTDALSVVALALARLGDIRVVEVLVNTVVNGPQSRHRLAAACALRTLARAELLPPDHAPQLYSLLDEEDRGALELSEIVAVLGWLYAVQFTPDVYRRFVAWAGSRDDWLGERSLDALARHKRLLCEPELLTRRLGLRRVPSGWDWSPSTESARSASFVIGLLYLGNPEQVTRAICSILREADWQTAYSVIRLLDDIHSRTEYPPLPAVVAEALLDRARYQQTRRYAETELFAVLARLAPNDLALAEWDRVWVDLLPDARTALASALGMAQCSRPDASRKAIAHLLLLARDGRYEVRRAAYRGLARRSMPALHATCWAWAGAPTAELRRRAAEAGGWLPSDEEWAEASRDLYSRLAADREGNVRETAERMRKERRERLWAEDYLGRILHMEDTSNEAILAMWPYSQALMQIGDDGCLQTLRIELRSPRFPPHMRHWLRRIAKGIEEHWRKVTQKWPEPWLPWEGRIEECEGLLVPRKGEPMEVHCSLWQKPGTTPSVPSSWGGAVWPVDLFRAPRGKLVVQLEDGRTGQAIRGSISGGVMILTGTGRYPE